AKPVASASTAPSAAPESDERIVHVLNRLAYGPRPGDVARVRAMGVQAWIERQLHPELIADEAIERRLAAYPTLRMTTAELFHEYPRPDPAAVARRREEMLRGGGAGEGMARDTGAEAPRPFRIAAELAAARMERAVWSERQLEE